MENTTRPTNLFRCLVTGIALLLSTQAFSEDEVREYHLKGTNKPLKLSLLENMLEERFSDLSRVHITSIRLYLHEYLRNIGIFSDSDSNRYAHHIIRFMAHVDDWEEEFKCTLSVHQSSDSIMLWDCKNEDYALYTFRLRASDLGIIILGGKKYLD